MQTIYNQGLRLSLGTFHPSPTQSLYIEANEPPLTLRWEKLSPICIKTSIQHINQNANNISPLTMSNLPPWTIIKTGVDLTLIQQKKTQPKPHHSKTDSMNLETNIQAILPFAPRGQKPYMEQEQQSTI